MTYAMFTSPNTYGENTTNKIAEVSLRRETENKIILNTVKRLSDEQMQDLYWVVLLMEKTGLSLKEILKGENICHQEKME